MTDITLSPVEAGYIKETLELCIEEMDGIEDSGEDYICMTGAREQAGAVIELINSWLLTVNIPEEGLDE